MNLPLLLVAALSRACPTPRFTFGALMLGAILTGTQTFGQSVLQCRVYSYDGATHTLRLRAASGRVGLPELDLDHCQPKEQAASLLRVLNTWYLFPRSEGAPALKQLGETREPRLSVTIQRNAPASGQGSTHDMTYTILGWTIELPMLLVERGAEYSSHSLIIDDPAVAFLDALSPEECKKHVRLNKALLDELLRTKQRWDSVKQGWIGGGYSNYERASREALHQMQKRAEDARRKSQSSNGTEPSPRKAP